MIIWVLFFGIMAALAILCLVCGPLLQDLQDRLQGLNPSECTDTPLELHQIAGFVTHAECDAIRQAALRKGLSRSTTVGTKGASSVRTSSTVFLGEKDDPVVGRVFAKVTRLLGVPKDRLEDMQVIRYTAGQKYDAHYDPCYRCLDDNLDMLREWTVLMYLNDGFQGGSTDFPLAGQSVSPRKGMAAVFRSMEGDKIVRQSKHQSTPVTDGTKWAATVWVSPAIK